MNPSEREELYIILYEEEEEVQRGSYYTKACYVIVKTKEEILPKILELKKGFGDRKNFKVYVLGKRLKVKWE